MPQNPDWSVFHLVSADGQQSSDQCAPSKRPRPLPLRWLPANPPVRPWGSHQGSLQGSSTSRPDLPPAVRLLRLRAELPFQETSACPSSCALSGLFLAFASPIRHHVIAASCTSAKSCRKRLIEFAADRIFEQVGRYIRLPNAMRLKNKAQSGT